MEANLNKIALPSESTQVVLCGNAHCYTLGETVESRGWWWRLWWWRQQQRPHRHTIICVEFHSHLIRRIVFCCVELFVGDLFEHTRRPLASLFLNWLCVCRKIAQKEFSIWLFFLLVGFVNCCYCVPFLWVVCFSILRVFLFVFVRSVKQCHAIYANALKLLFVMTVHSLDIPLFLLFWLYLSHRTIISIKDNVIRGIRLLV